MTVRNLYDLIESRLPPLNVEGIDSDGIHTIPNPDKEVCRVLIALDPYEKAVSEAIDGRYDVLITHHPLFWGEPVPNTPPENWYNRLMEAGIASFSFHIRLDKICRGVNDILAERLALKNVIPFDEPDIDSLGRIGDLEAPMTVRKFAEYVKLVLNAPTVTYTELPDNRLIKRVAVLGGSASDAISSAAFAGADAIVGGEFKHHSYGYASMESGGRGIAIIEAGHYHTEFPVCQRLYDLVKELIPGAEINILPCNNTFYI
jgi:dinuclear metal center YbgI/SA1388 family protein